MKFDCLKEANKIYKWFNKYLGRLVHGTYKIELGEEFQSEIEYPHTHNARIFIKNTNDLKELFMCMFHEYLHVMLSPIGLEMRNKLKQTKSKSDLILYLIEEMDCREENLVHMLEVRLGNLLYEVYRKNK